MKLLAGSSLVLTLAGLLCQLVGTKQSSSKGTKQTWTYEYISVEDTTSNSDLLDHNWRVERISRGVYSISAELTFNFDIVEGDDNTIEVAVLRSVYDGGDFRPTPFEIPKLHFITYLNTFYKDMIMDTFKECSNMPVFTDTFESPFKKGTYILDKCQFRQDGFPQHMQDGFYKIIFIGHGTVDWSLTFNVEIMNKF